MKKEDEKELSAIKERLENFLLIYDNVSDLICLIEVGKDGKFRLADVNPSYVRVTGLTKEQLIGRNVEELMPEKEVAFVLDKYRETIEAGSPITYEETVNIPGLLLIVEVTMIPIFNERKECTHLLGVARDITERKKAEEELKEKEEMLRKSDRLTIAGKLAAGVAHEVRNPLTVLQGFIQLWRNESGTRTEYLELMLGEIQRIESIINEFLMLSTPNEMKFERKNPLVLLKALLPLFETQAILNNIKITTSFETDVPPIECVENQIKQVFTNVLKNALEATHDGGKIHIEVKEDGNRNVIIRFIDNGCGIPLEKIEKLGEPFYTTKEKGTGLGLMVSYNIIRNHRGSVSIESEPGKGTMFEIVLPAAP